MRGRYGIRALALLGGLVAATGAMSSTAHGAALDYLVTTPAQPDQTHTIVYRAASGETNRPILRNDAPLLGPARLFVLTDAVPLERGGASPGTTLTHCPVIVSTFALCSPLLGSDLLRLGARVNVDFALGDQNDRLEIMTGGNLGDSKVDLGAGDDLFIGSENSDEIVAGPGADTILGRGGTDTVDYSNYVEPVFVTLDGVANDGAAGEGDNLVTIDIVIGAQTAPNTLIGGPGSQTLRGGAQADTLDARSGTDFVVGGAGDDSIQARDGQADIVHCGPGLDDAVVDVHDQVDADCENVDVG